MQIHANIFVEMHNFFFECAKILAKLILIL